MVKNIEINNLKRHLVQFGPYLYYFNAHRQGRNFELVRKMNLWSKKYPFLYILEVEFDNTSKNKMNVRKNEINNIYLYYDGQKIKELINPNDNELKEIIHQSIDFYNKKLDRLSANAGNRRKKKRLDYIEIDIQEEICKKKLNSAFNNYINKQQRKKIIVTNDEIPKETSDDIDLFAYKLGLIRTKKISKKKEFVYKKLLLKTYLDKNIKNKTQKSSITKLPLEKSKKSFEESKKVAVKLRRNRPILPNGLLASNITYTNCYSNTNIYSVQNNFISANSQIQENLLNPITSKSHFFNNNSVFAIPMIYINNINITNTTNISENINNHKSINPVQKLDKNFSIKSSLRVSKDNKFTHQKQTISNYCNLECQKNLIASPIYENWYNDINMKDLPNNILNNNDVPDILSNESETMNMVQSDISNMDVNLSSEKLFEFSNFV